MHIQLNEQNIQGNWKEVRADLINTWGELTFKELENAKGNLYCIADIVHQKYGEDLLEIEKKMADIICKYQPH